MKRTLLTALIALTCMTASATRQINDKVKIYGETWEIPASPLLSLDSETYAKFRTLLGEKEMVSSANQRGYVATWHVGKRGLYLDKVETMQSNGEMKEIDMTQLKKVLNKYKDKGMIRAEWYSGSIKIGKGFGDFDPSNPHTTSFAENWVLDMKKGKVKNL